MIDKNVSFEIPGKLPNATIAFVLADCSMGIFIREILILQLFILVDMYSWESSFKYHICLTDAVRIGMRINTMWSI